ncbi:gastrula zinc finger protein XlCGF7.1-like [Chironomus tepperi]|uniref:gastrula zinc finger protein XlCGF7.1-like n=1 Tax=Chironomus tepperi TaxID=113505 RepID=UPI00391EF92F
MSAINDSSCRICLTSNSAFISVFGKFHNRLVKEIIENLVKIKIDEVLKSPKFICQLCLTKLLQAETIIDLCRKNHEFLSELSKIEEESAVTVDEIIIEEIVEPSVEPSDIELEIEVDEPQKSTFFCSACGQDFSTRQKLLYHEKTKHNTCNFEPQTFTCDRCGHIFKQKSHVINHMNVVHLKIKRFHCDICDFKMYSKTHYTSHLKTHSNVKDFICPQCDKAFARKTTLDTHLKTHTGQRDYICKFCSKSYTAHTDLKRHLSQHTNKKPYNCNLCNDGFTLKRQLFDHIRTKHPGKDTSSWLTGKTSWSELMR